MKQYICLVHPNGKAQKTIRPLANLLIADDYNKLRWEFNLNTIYEKLAFYLYFKGIYK